MVQRKFNHWFNNLSIRLKLVTLFTITAAIALAIACVVFWAYEVASYRATLKREAVTLASMLADSTSAAIAFDDRRATAEALTTLRAEPRIVAACVYGKNGAILARYSANSETSVYPPESMEEKASFQGGRLVVTHGVTVDRERVGAVLLVFDLSEMYQSLIRNALLGLAVMLVAAFCAMLLASALQRLISRPILHLTEVASRVSAGRNYAIRATPTGDDEVGRLIQSFNEMMEQIHRRDLALHAAQDELEWRVQARTRELQNEISERKLIERDLINAKQAAEESNRAKSAFLANMSHELRTPLNAVIGYSEMLEEDAVLSGDRTTVPDLQKIQKAGRHLLALINDVLDLSKIEAGRMEVHIEPVAIASLVREVAGTVEPLVRRNGNQLVVETNGYDGVIEVDPIKFRQSLLNLMSNASKFTENGTVALKVDRSVENGREWIHWQVSDTGIGIAPEDTGKLFQSFSQIDSSATRKFGGTGLGLAISQRFCQMMGGNITVQSEPGKGSTFTIHLPTSPLPIEPVVPLAEDTPRPA